MRGNEREKKKVKMNACRIYRWRAAGRNGETAKRHVAEQKKQSLRTYIHTHGFGKKKAMHAKREREKKHGAMRLKSVGGRGQGDAAPTKKTREFMRAGLDSGRRSSLTPKHSTVQDRPGLARYVCSKRETRNRYSSG